MKSTDSTVYIVESNLIMRQFLQTILEKYKIQTTVFSSAEQFLNHHHSQSLKSNQEPCCLLSHFYPIDMSGLELLQRTTESDRYITTLFFSEKVSLEISLQAIREGAIDFLVTPFCQQALLTAIQRALYRDAHIKSWQNSLQHAQRKLSRLTPREKQVFELVAQGLLNKQIAWELNIGIKTVKVHRAQVMRKLDVRTLADLVRLSEKLKQTLYNPIPGSFYQLDAVI
jgi:FixJ family two-component response regulator